MYNKIKNLFYYSQQTMDAFSVKMKKNKNIFIFLNVIFNFLYRFVKKIKNKNDISSIDICSDANNIDTYNYINNKNIYNSVINKDISIINKKFIVIVTVQHTLSLAKMIKKELDEIGISSCIFLDMPDHSLYKDNIHIILCAQKFDKMPDHYFIFNLEQTSSSRWFNSRYISFLNNSIAIIDYSIKNIKFFVDLGIDYKKIFYIPIFSTRNINHKNEEYIYDILFYGDTNNKKRKNILTELKKYYNIYVVNNIFGDNIIDIIKKSKIILNIHYYDNAYLEMNRIMECLTYNKNIISEKSIDQNDYGYLNGIVNFVDIDNVEQMKNTIEFILNQDVRKLEYNIRCEISKRFNLFKFYFYRLLLAYDFISFDIFYNLIGCAYKLKSDNICLSIPEAMRRESFIKNKVIDNIQIFECLRHYNNFIENGLNYKFLFRKAKELKFNRIIIFKDNVILYDNNEEVFKNIIKYINNTTKWDVFSIFVNNLHKNIEIKNFEFVDGNCFIEIDKVISTLFNIYNNSIYDLIDSWDENNREVENTIDRYIEKIKEIKIITTPNYLIGYKEKLCDINNYICNKEIKNNEKELLYKILDYILKNMDQVYSKYKK